MASRTIRMRHLRTTSLSGLFRPIQHATLSTVGKYNHLRVEEKWQQYWEDNKTFMAKRRPGHQKKYILDMFPYPSGSGLHVGHPEGYTATDILARYYRMKNYDVLHPMGWDAFGLPAEQHAINTNTHPAETTKNNIAVFKKQLRSLGFSYDWDRELSTTDINYVKWTQWIFLKLFEMGLATQSEVPVNWCPKLGTILANEEVIGGVSERGGHPVTKMPLRQWLLKITDFADVLESDLKGLHWPEGTLSAQKSWIGRSEGVKVKFSIVSQSKELTSDIIEIFTTRIDTLFGVTYLVLAPEHKLLRQLTSASEQEKVEAYLAHVSSRSDTDRLAGWNSDSKMPTGAFLGSYARHPLTNELLPLWVGDYVLGHYGTGAVMAVPAHDERDHQFALLNHLPIKVVISSSQHESPPLPFTAPGILTNSQGYNHLNGLSSSDGKQKILEYLQQTQSGEISISYKLRDWIFSRQRYWGEPIPIFFPVEIPDGQDPRLGCSHTIRYDQPIPVPYDELPLRLPELSDFRPGENPDPQGCLARVLEWKYFQKNGKWYARETNTMPQWAGSCWYYIRFADPANNEQFISPQAMKDWLPVDIYVGGQEHAVLHLLYARFWHKALHKLNLLDHPEPFPRVIHQGLILGSDGEKMSKSKGNVVNPDSVVQEYGADALRLYEMFMGPLEASKPWQTEQLQGVVRFRERLYGLVVNYSRTAEVMSSSSSLPEDSKLIREMHRTIQRVTNDIETLSFNTAISTLMIYLNTLQGEKERLPKEAIENLVLLLSPIAPHVAEECWEILGNKTSLAHHPWPLYQPELCEPHPDELSTVAVQINGKLRTTIQVRKEANQYAAEQVAMNLDIVQKHLSGKVISKTIFVPGKILNFVLKKEE